MKFTTVAPQNAVNSEVPCPADTMPRKFGLYAVKIKSLISWALTRQFVGYANNRGTGVVDESRVNKMAGNLHICSMDGFKICVNDEVAEMADGHDRLQALLIRWWAGGMSEDELEEEVSVRILPDTDFVTVYRDSHEGQKSVSKKQQIQDTNFVYGDILFCKVLPLCSDQAQKFFRKSSSFYDIMASIVYAIHSKEFDMTNDDEWNFPNVYPCRKHLDSTLYEKKGVFRLSREAMIWYAQVLDDYYDLVCQVPSSNKSVHTVLRRAAFFGFYVVEKMCQKSALSSVRNTILAKHLQDKIIDIDPVVCLLLNSTQRCMEKNCSELYKLIMPRRRKVAH